MGLFQRTDTPPDQAKHVEPATPFAGWIDGKPAVSAPHVLVTGPTGVGKSRRVLAPGAIMWKGPVVAVSSKPDLIELCLEPRLAKGGHERTYVLDLSGEVPDRALPDGVRKVVVDPSAMIKNDDDALDMATVLMQSGSVGGGGGSVQGGDAFWESTTVGPFAAILRAAGDDGIAWARRAIELITPDDADDAADETTASWAHAVDRLKALGSDLAGDLAGACKLDAKLRDSIGSTMRAAISPWRRSTVRGTGSELVFTPRLLEHRRATLFVVAPADGVAAGAAVACVDFITKRWRANQTEEKRLPRLLLVVDEVTNTMPWPKLPTVVTESRAMGIHLLIACQNTLQFAKRYGRDGMEELRAVFPAVLILAGAEEDEMLEKAAKRYGETERQRTSIDHLSRQSQTAERVPTLTAAELLPLNKNVGRLLRGRRPGDSTTALNAAGVQVDLDDISRIQFTTASSAAR